MTPSIAEQKSQLRARIRAARERRSAAERRDAALAIRDVLLATAEMAAAQVVAAYLSTASEPGTGPLLDAIAGRCRVLVPVQRPDGELDWAGYAADVPVVAGPRGIAEPAGERLGPAALAAAEVVVVPALAVDRHGNRLGQGKGFYDRALTHAGPAAMTVALTFDDEVLDAIPVDGDDVRVRAVATPTGLRRVQE